MPYSTLFDCFLVVEQIAHKQLDIQLNSISVLQCRHSAQQHLVQDPIQNLA